MTRDFGQHDEFIEEAAKEIASARSAFALSRDTVGRIDETLTAAQGTHDAAVLMATARKKLAISKTQFEIWLARRKRIVKNKLIRERKHSLRVYNMAPANKKGIRPGEVKESDVKDYITCTKAYRLWREEINNLEYVVELAEKAYFKPMETRSQLIMSLNKLVFRESPI